MRTADNKFVLPDLYRQCLRWIAERDGLPPCRLQPAQLNQVVALEEELECALPVEYENHLLLLGCGEEHGGVASWLHLDFTHPGNILSENERWAARGKPADFLVIYNSLGSSLFGYILSRSSEEIYLWEGQKPEKYSSDLGEFYRERLDCSPEEIAAIELGEIEV